ncbi:OmpA family protein [Enterobacter roggenkampii]|uniref:OmpA family protein n=1 Tax=Enterobacter roggenkampii TaxID=1812935 RepID=UPI002075FB0D|nr:OmpA family protein [Enterobacter roggenkampii]MCM7870485.1 OmpA family protein [Enterobacter roggenkampii]
MRDKYRSLLTALGAVLALWLILGFWPLSTGSRLALGLLVVLVAGVIFWCQRRASLARATAVREIVDESLPPEDFQGAVVFVCGDNTPLFVSGTRHRETRQGWYLWVKDAEQLPLFAQHLSLVRPALVSQISVMLAVVPEQNKSDDDFTQSLRGWQRAVVQCRAAFGTLPPLWTVTWVTLPAACAEAEPVWFTTVSQRSGIQVYQPGQGNVSLTEWARETGSNGRFSRLSQGLWLDSLLAWQNSAVNDLLSVRRGELLDDWLRRGEPLRYRLGLYQGLRLVPLVEAALSDWAPPPPPPPIIKKIIQGPKTIRLDSMSLFDSGKSVLKAGSTRMLVNSLVGIKAKPGWLIVVSGHTDNTGNPQLNQTLSLKRAEAVRNWMRDTGDVPESCFAVQGYGESRPVATNDTLEGRALNRRVEISLVPQANACQIPGKHPAPSQDDGVSENKTE